MSGKIATRLGDFRRLEWDVAAWILFVKFSLYAFALAAVPALANRHTPLLELLGRWDAARYLRLARDGYQASGDERFDLVGLPLFPWLVRVVSWTGLGVGSAALVVSGVASIAAGWWLLRLARFDFKETEARLALWFLFIFPTSYFLHVAYTEATMLALALGCFVAARKQHWALAGVLGGLAALTRLQGLVLFPAVAFEAWLQYRATRRWHPSWLWLAAIPSGFGVYLLLNYHVTGDPFAFTKLMHENFFRELKPPWVGAAALWDNLLWEKPEEFVMVGLAEAFFTLLALGMTIWSWFALRASYAIWMTGNFLLCVCSSFVLGVPRYTLVMFPIFLLCAQASRRRPWLLASISLWSLLLLALFFTKYAFGHWAF